MSDISSFAYPLTRMVSNNSLNRLFIDTDAIVKHLTPEEQKRLLVAENARQKDTKYKVKHHTSTSSYPSQNSELPISTLGVLLDEAQDSMLHKIILEGGPGQGKSTITQMLAQIHRHPKVERSPLDPEGRWISPKKLRIPFRIELQQFANKLGHDWKSVEEYLVSITKDAAGGREFSVTDLHDIISDFPILLIFDGLDEVGSEQHIEDVLLKITECIFRCENSFHSNLRVVITTRPPAIIGHREHLAGFIRIPIAPMSSITIDQYLQRWLEYQITDPEDKKRVPQTFKKRQNEPHVKGLVRNPMQLSVVLYLIEMREEAFPDRRTELYTAYFQKVIEREITKSPELHRHQEIIAALHEFLGYKIHALTETKDADGTLGYHQLLQIVEEWLKDQKNGTKANELFTLGRDRLGLIVALKGEGENANFGYEIQPVREYFAAAFINNQIVGDSHDAFQEMTRRPYWREVALFLAGMVKSKEKADLISRARSIDRDETLGWRQDGRSIILQLLQEGVFSQPSRVFIDGLDFVFELLDPRRVSKQKTVEDILETIPFLVQQTTDQQKYIDLLSEILDYYKCSDDDYIIYRLYSVASRLFEPEKMRKTLMSYEGTSPDIITKARVGWPYSWNIKMYREAQNPAFWEKVPDYKWTEQLWLSHILLWPNHTISVTDLPIPHRLHQYLMEFWALDPISTRLYAHFQSKDSSYSNWAVWKLTDYQHKIDLYLDKRLIRKQFERIIPKQLSSEDNLDINIVGLYPEIQQLAADLVKIFHDILKILSNGQPKENLVNHFPILKKYLIKPGLSSLMACRCAVSILKCIIALSRDTMQLSDEWWDIFADLQIFYKELRTENKAPHEYYKEDRTGLEKVLLNLEAPSYIRLNTEGDIANIADLIVDTFCNTEQDSFGWLRHIPLSTDTIKPLVEKNKNKEYDLLRAFSNMNFISIQPAEPLSTQQIQRILTIADTTDNPQILSGTLSALSTSNFLNLASPGLVLKLLRAEYNNTIFLTSFSASLFRTQTRYFIKSNNENIDENMIETIAKEVLASPHDYAFRVVCDAATYLIEHTNLSLPPILHMEQKLGLYIAHN